jgi:hypothetical protein
LHEVGQRTVREMVDVTRSSVPVRELAALGRGGRPSPMLVASVTDGRREADVAA